MIGDDFQSIKRCFDLKGSSLHRTTKMDKYQEVTGETGLKVLKDQNHNERMDISGLDPLLETLKSDSELLRKHQLIDYSVFLIEVDRQKRLKTGGIGSLVYDALNKEYIMRGEQTATEPKEEMSATKMKFKKAVFKTVESNSINLKKSDGFLNLESNCGQFRYKIGLIDFLTKYNNLKMIENQLKASINNVDQIEVSAIDQDRYCERFN